MKLTSNSFSPDEVISFSVVAKDPIKSWLQRDKQNIHMHTVTIGD